MTDRYWLITATLLALVNSAWGIYAFGAKTRHSTRWSDGLLWAAFGCQIAFLSVRGQHLGHCPVTNLFEVVAFLTWSLLLTYLVVGSVYRFSILGLFTAPVVSVLNFLALVLPIDTPGNTPPMGWALELHASVTTLAYGPLGISAIAGVLYLIQERQLKQHSLGTWFYSLPPMGDIAVILRRVLLFGFCLLTVGLLAGVLVALGHSMDWVKFGWSLVVWLLYALILIAPRVLHFSLHRTAWCSVVGYLIVLLTFWGINSISHQHRFEFPGQS
jgi:ABC-type uncharacterized transport system permease subunit